MGVPRAGTETQPPSGEAVGPGSTESPRQARHRRWIEAGVFVLAAAALFVAYLRLSRTVPENSDQANILLAASDMLHGNLLLHGWYLTDVSFYTTELPQYVLLEIFFGVHANTAHIAAAMTYTLAVLLAVLLARGGISDRQAVIRMLITAGIMLAPQLGIGIFALILTVGHIGTAIPVMLVWLILDRAGPEGRPAGTPRHRADPSPRAPVWVPVAVALLLAWVLIADQIVLVVAVVPLALVCAVRIVEGAVRARSLSRGVRARRYELSLIAAAGAATGIAWVAERVIRALGGYVLNPIPFTFTFHGFVQNLHSLWAVPQIFGADYRGLAGASFALAVLHLVSLVLVGLGVLLAALRFFSGITLVDQVLAVAIVLNLVLFVVTSAGSEGPHEIAIVAPFGAVLAARMLAAPARQSAEDPGAATARIGSVLSGWVRAAAYLAGAAVLACYLAGLAHEVAQPASPSAYSRVAAWLEAHDLRYGLGGYWESGIVTVETGGQVKVRAVLKKTMGPDLWLAKTSWYDPASQQATFIVLSSTPGFMNNWEPRTLIRKYFGRPTIQYNFGPYTVMVWDRNLLPSVPHSSGGTNQ
jgi:hypothetical protein